MTWTAKRRSEALALHARVVAGELSARVAAASLGVTKSAFLALVWRASHPDAWARRHTPIDVLASLTRLPMPEGCRYIFGDTRKPGWTYCGACQFPGRSYCEQHARMCYVKDDRRTI